MSFVDENVLNLQLTSMVEMNDDNHVKTIKIFLLLIMLNVRQLRRRIYTSDDKSFKVPGNKLNCSSNT